MTGRYRILFVFLLSGAGTAMAQNKADALAMLNVTPSSAGETVLDALQTGSAYHDMAYKAFKALAPADRGAIVKTGLAWVKSYTATAEFASKYAAFRNEHKPKPPESVPTVEEYFTKQRKELETSIAEGRKSMAGADAETRKTLEATYKQMMDQITSMEKDPAQRNMMAQMLDAQRAENKNRCEEALAEWNRGYPENPKNLIAGRIREFLEMSADVDFGARLVKQGSSMRFEQEEYETKPSDWKLCFRAGKEAVTAARMFLQAWLGELEGK